MQVHDPSADRQRGPQLLPALAQGALITACNAQHLCCAGFPSTLSALRAISPVIQKWQQARQKRPPSLLPTGFALENLALLLSFVSSQQHWALAMDHRNHEVCSTLGMAGWAHSGCPQSCPMRFRQGMADLNLSSFSIVEPCQQLMSAHHLLWPESLADDELDDSEHLPAHAFHGESAASW